MKMKKVVCAMVSAALLVSMAAATAFAVESVPSKTGTDADAGKTDVSVSGSVRVRIKYYSEPLDFLEKHFIMKVTGWSSAETINHNTGLKSDFFSILNNYNVRIETSFFLSPKL